MRPCTGPNHRPISVFAPRLGSKPTHVIAVRHTGERHTVASDDLLLAGREVLECLFDDERAQAVDVEDKVGAGSGSVGG